MILICKILSPLHPRMLWAKFRCNWLIGSGEEEFKISSIYLLLCYYLSLERAWLFIWRNWIPFTQKCFLPSLVQISIQNQIFTFSQCIFAFSLLSPLGKEWTFILTNFNSLHSRMLHSEIGWNQPIDSGD